jgi:hypothetical protein
MARTLEPQYEACFAEPPVTLGPMTGSSWRWNAKRMTWYCSRYKFISRMLAGLSSAAEIGCADAFASRIVAQEVPDLTLYDFDPVWVRAAKDGGALEFAKAVHCVDITKDPLGEKYNGIYCCDMIEHVYPKDEPAMMENVCRSLYRDGIFIAGAPSLEFQQYSQLPRHEGGSGELSRVHVNCRSGEMMRADMRKYFRNVLLFSMNDEVVHTGDPRMAAYLFTVCIGPR